MIPSTTNKLLVTEDWKKIYQSYKNADFKSYDFETLRRTMITYLRENYPEDFNDYIDSSEYIALIDLIAYLGQNLSFRIDLNARENFLETAERRESILRLARLINYNAKRNVPASGLLKINSVLTTDSVLDSNNINLANTVVSWNDSTNPNWYQQFIAILNSAMISTSSFGKPTAKGVIEGIRTEQYKLNTNNSGVPVYTFNKSINGINLTFEIVSTDLGDSLKEQNPKPGNAFSFVYRNDNQGNNSSNTGFFVHFKQGTLSIADFTIDNPVPNEVIGIDAPNINDTDVWLWQLNADGTYPDSPWTKVAATSGNNVIYNSISGNRNIYAVLTRDQDQIDLNFADGSFGNLPKGAFKLFYRQSNGSSYNITPAQLSNISFDITYVNKAGQTHTLTILAGLNYPVTNASGPESDADIKLKAPQVYYSQNRMVTGEDYNILPLTAGTDILKVKTVNRISSGISRYYELSDVSGKYSSLNVFANDGIIYKETNEYSFEYDLGTKNEIRTAIRKNLKDVVTSKEFRSFYYDRYTRPSFSGYNIKWVQGTKTTNQTTGYFEIDELGINQYQPVPAGEFSSNNLKFATEGALIKFKAPMRSDPSIVNNTSTQQTYFLPNGKLTFKPDNATTDYKWSKVVNIVLDGYNEGKGLLSSGLGPVTITGNIPTDAVPEEIIPKFVSVISEALETEIINLSLTKGNFGIGLDQEKTEWYIISDSNIDLRSDFSLLNQKDSSNTNKDSSWMIAFEWTGKKYKVRYRVIDYLFESQKETAFYVDTSKINYDYINDSVIKDKITVLGINTDATATTSIRFDQEWQIDDSVLELDGYQNPKKVKISFYDKDEDGLIDNPDSFELIVKPDSINVQSGFKDKFVVFKRSSDGLRYNLIDSTDFYFYPTESNVPNSQKEDGQFFYFYDPSADVVKKWSSSLGDFDLQVDYFARPGRSGLKFSYNHKAVETRRIDPSKTNLMDIYMLTKSYDTDFRNWLISDEGLEPLAPTSQSLEILYSSALTPIKSISDELVFHPVSYKILFGNRAAPLLQATFKAVRNSSRPTSDNDLKARILKAISDFFAIENWEFGQSFYFSELATYVMNIMSPDITNFVIVPKQNSTFGSLFEIKCQGNEVFISSASATDIEIIDSLTATEIKSSGNIVTTSGGQQ